MDITSINAKLSKKINRAIVLKKLYNNRPIYREDLAKVMGFTECFIYSKWNYYENIYIIDNIFKLYKILENIRWTLGKGIFNILKNEEEYTNM